MPANVLFQGDNLDVLRRHLADDSVQLIYVDPPFFSQAVYRLNGAHAFKDRWSWNEAAEKAVEELLSQNTSAARAIKSLGVLTDRSGLLAYLATLALRFHEFRRVLAPTGNIFIHCDPRASHYVKVVMDAVFGRDNFRNEIIWHYGGRGAKAVSRQFPRNHDTILFYSKSGRAVYKQQRLAKSVSFAEARARGLRPDGDGLWFKTAPAGDYTEASLARLEKEGRIYRTSTNGRRVKYFLESTHDSVVEESLVGDTWLDIPDAMHLPLRERLGYPTQKPEALLERIIQAATDEGDCVLDPFCGSGTALVVAERLKRRWIGIDDSRQAIEMTQTRLESVNATFESRAAATLAQ